MSTECANVPICMVHGDKDDLVPFEVGEMTAKALGSENRRVEFREYSMGHCVGDDELEALGFFLQRSLPRVR
jgi:predicted esterase